MGFGADLRKIRVSKGYSLRGFAKEVGISATYLSKIEREEFEPCSADVIARVAGLLDLHPDITCLKAKKIPNWIRETLFEYPRLSIESLERIKNGKR